ncbi:MAG: hypothetical protein A2Y12_05570 [Planctomycetes bacterium GWF2_42_9]|nr:MAG: hypothetical protein A2Y12_05570 [Planctomycetes bacterium GWF2_42_9]
MRVKGGEIRLRQLCDQTRLLKRFVKYLGKNCNVADITTISLQQYRTNLVKSGNAASTVNNHISVFKAMFNWAMDNEVLNAVPNLKAIKKSSCSKQTKFIFTADQIKLLVEANTQMKAMIWLGLNCGFGCTDCSELLWKHLDLDNGRADFARTKTNIGRNLPL